jgi:SAM-dependent methyltransferase
MTSVFSCRPAPHRTCHDAAGFVTRKWPIEKDKEMRQQIDSHNSETAKVKGSTGGRLQRRALRIWKQDYLHYKYLWPNLEWAARAALEHTGTNRPTVLDIGCGHKPYRDLFAMAQHWGMDHGIVDTSPDFVGDALRLPVRDQSVDIVFATQVIEHVTNPHIMVQECKRVLRPNGCLILSGPFFWPLHEEPYDFFRFTKYGFQQLLKDAGFCEWQIREDGGDWAQLMLSMCLRLNKWLFPLRCAVNLTGALLDRAIKSTRLPANYTVLAKV